jgi:hypothetical protein
MMTVDWRSFEFHTFAELKAHFDTLADQMAGLQGAICQTGQPYREFTIAMLARPDDVAVIEKVATNAMARDVGRYFDGREGTIYWRIPLEVDIAPYEVVTRYANDGPDTDFLTDQKCFKDKNWVGVKAYCRVFKALHRTAQAA